MENFYISTAISYTNGPPHMGHAYEIIAADVIARFNRLKGKKVFFLTGTDEHGLKVQQKAEKLNITPEELAYNMSKIFIKMAKELNCSNDDFIRTSEERHKKAVNKIWHKMTDNGDIYLDNYSGAPGRPPEEQHYLPFLKGELYRMIQDYNLTHNSV